MGVLIERFHCSINNCLSSGFISPPVASISFGQVPAADSGAAGRATLVDAPDMAARPPSALQGDYLHCMCPCTSYSHTNTVYILGTAKGVLLLHAVLHFKAVLIEEFHCT